MVERSPEDVTLCTVHDDLKAGFADLKTEMRTGFADLKQEVQTGFADLKTEMRELKATLVTGFGGLPTRESSEEMVRLLREANRLQEERFTQLELRIREQHLETQQVLHALVEGQRGLVDQVRALAGQIGGLSTDIKALIARLDALIKGPGDGRPTA
ncbi:MAG: hypothetical protein HY726_03775 [Candidatus Rokubacteria bacterium]|nr:hypothetical protein [Candidatus Rokubacteria bacterium]